MSNNLNNKVAYITGGSKGIGYGIAKILLENGMKVAISSRSLGAAQQAAASLSNDASKVLAIESDVSLMDAETKAIKTIIDHFGQLDVLVANAFGNFRALLEAVTLNTAMGYYLNTRGNSKENTATGRAPALPPRRFGMILPPKDGAR